MAGVACSNHVRPTKNLRTNSNILRISSNENENEIFWDHFKEYLQTQNNTNTINDRLNYAKIYYYILQNNDPSDILSLSFDKRIHIMKALKSLSKFSGCYDYWKSLISRHNLKWSSGDSLNVFQNIINERNYGQMIQWVKDVISKLPESYYNTIIYNTLTALRPREAIISISLIQKDLENYLNQDKLILEHFRFPEIFIRRTKKAYITIITDTITNIAKSCGNYSYHALKLMIRRKGIAMNMAFCRKIFATHLRNNGIEQEIIDLLQGRIPKSVFARHYFRPDFNHNRIKESINSLYNSLT
jgi:Archaeal phage integrase